MMNTGYLAEKNPHPLDANIKFDEGPHTYHIDGDSNYKSVTTWNHSHFGKFDSDKIIEKMMSNPEKWKKNKYFGMTKLEIKSLWRENGRKAAESGTKMHYDIECFYNNKEVENSSIEYEYFLRFYKQNNELKPYRTEWMIYDKELRFAGSIDMIFENEDGTLEIYDWKRSKEIKKENKWQSAITPCIEHLPDSNFWHYALQLNTYKALLEKNYGKKVKGLYLICLHPDNKNSSYQKIKVPTLKREIRDLFDLRRKLLINEHT
jgi:ATP-dependent exoDNAse (exonuclease V) beta subunit